jgi:putative Mg2+ transporter-C (MgtC) family protein
MPDGSVWGLVGLGWLRLDLLLRLLLAAVLGGLVGVEREISGKPAGFRTNLLICVGATLLTELSIGVATLAPPGRIAGDPARIAAQIVSGIGFLGAGTIIQSRGSVVGLTTAATLWVVAAIGMAVGARAYIEAVGTTVLVITALFLLGRLEDIFVSQRLERTLQVTIEPHLELVDRVSAVLREAGYSAALIEIERAPDRVTVLYETVGPRARWDPVVNRLIRTPGVIRVGRV